VLQARSASSTIRIKYDLYQGMPSSIPQVS
jgi:hypothetical protein